jgi:transcriptional regulator with XRE-family HTH domain
MTNEEKKLLQIGKKLKEFRIARGYTNYEHFAYEIGISRSQYGNYENGANMKLTTLFKILTFLKVPIEEFFQGINENQI